MHCAALPDARCLRRHADTPLMILILYRQGCMDMYFRLILRLKFHLTLTIPRYPKIRYTFLFFSFFFFLSAKNLLLKERMRQNETHCYNVFVKRVVTMVLGIHIGSLYQLIHIGIISTRYGHQINTHMLSGIILILIPNQYRINT